MARPAYNRTQSYRWNYENAPEPITATAAEIPDVPGEWTFCGLPVRSPLGMPAGPLLNGKWILYYASLGFDVLTYKTVRSGRRECYPLPNLVPIETGQLAGGEGELPELTAMTGSWAVSFGMPSSEPSQWRTDIEATRAKLPREKLLSVSVVGTVQPEWSIEDLAADYAQCARWACESGADAIETNFSCPNVATCDGQLYQQPGDAAIVAQAVREAIGKTPFIIKIGHVEAESDAIALLDAVSCHADSLAMTNSVAATVRGTAGDLLFDGQKRGICGAATFEASLRQTQLFARLIEVRKDSLRIIGVGGASTADHVQQYLSAGAECVHIATAAMIDPEVGLRIRQDLRRPSDA